MRRRNEDLRILHLSSFPPRLCGIANFCKQIVSAISKIDTSAHQKVIALEENENVKREYPPLVSLRVIQEDLSSYEKVGKWIGKSGANVLFLQHEFNLFGGFDGIFILELLKRVKIPIVSFLHTVPVLKNSMRRNYRLRILKEIAKKSKFLCLPSKKAIEFLNQECKIKKEKMIFLPHGGFELPFTNEKEREELKKKYNFSGKFLVLSYGLIIKSKGFEYAIEAIAKIKEKFPHLRYLILGVPHPLLQESPENNYYLGLKERVKKLKLEDRVIFLQKFITQKELIDYLRMADVVLLPYTTKYQISSGVLTHAMTVGACIVSTPFIYAKEILGNGRGIFIEFENPDSIAKKLIFLIENHQKIEKLRKKTWEFGKNFGWKKISEKILLIFSQAKKHQEKLDKNFLNEI